jgi:adenine-specific DNA-methyltransferase
MKEPPNKLYINDNLITLKSLKDDSIDCIYTDPPYLTGNSKLTYKDNKKESEWIEFMRERLVECKRVMKKSATMLIHIDENMHIELAQLCYQVFGKKNHLTTFVWKKRTNVSSQSKFAGVEHEYIIAAAKDIGECKWNGIPQFEPTYEDEDGTQLARRFDKVSKTERNPESRPNATYPLYHSTPNYPAPGHEISEDDPMYMGGRDGYGDYKHINLWGTGVYKENDGGRFPLHANKTRISLTPFPGSIEILPMNGKELGCWRAIPATCQKLIDANMLVVKNNKIYQKQYAHYQFNKKTGQLEPFVRTTPIHTILQGEKFPTNLRSNAEIKEIYGKTAFTYAKPVDLVKNLLKVVSNEGDVVLDIFAGSGTTGQAAYEIGRKFILCQLDEGGIPELIKQRLDMKVGKENYEVILPTP